MFYKGKRLQKKTSKFKILSIPCIVIALILTFSYFLGIGNTNKKSDNKNFSKNTSSSTDLSKKDTRITQEYTYNYEDNSIISKTKEIPENLEVEIALLLEKNNLTYQDLINMAISNYNAEFTNLFIKYSNLDSNKIIDILKGNRVNLRDTLFIGDSRTQGMLLSGVINDANTVYGVGYGYNWLIGNGNFSSNKTNALNGGIMGIESKMQGNASYDVVIWLGVNDYRYCKASKYFEAFSDLAKNNFSNHNIYIVSVGPVDDSRASTVSNEGINEFNAEMKDLVANSNISNLNYIDLNFTEDSIKGYDGAGLHYSSSDYQNIYNIVNSNITKSYDNDMKDILSLFYKVIYNYDISAEIKENNNLVRTRVRDIYE